MPHNEIKIYLENLDQEPKVLASANSEHVSAEAIKDILEKNANYTPTKEDM